MLVSFITTAVTGATGADVLDNKLKNYFYSIPLHVLRNLTSASSNKCLDVFLKNPLNQPLQSDFCFCKKFSQVEIHISFVVKKEI